MAMSLAIVSILGVRPSKSVICGPLRAAAKPIRNVQKSGLGWMCVSKLAATFVHIDAEIHFRVKYF
jgi:hypothetical protein